MVNVLELENNSKRVGLAHKLNAIEPDSVQGIDFKDLDVLESYKLACLDEKGLYGCAVLSKRSIDTLPNHLKGHMFFSTEQSYYELSLIFSCSPFDYKKFDGIDPDEETDVTYGYYLRFYNEILEFFEKELSFSGYPTIVVRTTYEESEMMKRHGDWLFESVEIDGENFLGLLVLREDIVFLNKFQKKVIQ